MEKQVNAAWGGRFADGPATRTAEFTDSQHYDRIMYREDIQASIAHAHMLANQGIISREEADQIETGLMQILHEIESGQFEWQRRHEDLHMNIEARLIQIAGAAGKKLHTARSRNDQTALTLRLYVSARCGDWQKGCRRLCSVLAELAERYADVILPGYTHLQPAQPVSLAQHLLAYAAMFRRDHERLEDAQRRIRISPLGAAALAGSGYPVNPALVAAEVGFNDVFSNSMDAVSDRDFCLEALFAASVIAMHLSRLCEEIVLWANPGFGFISLPDLYATGSSIMPQKKNPDVAELMRGKTGRVYGNLNALLVTMKGLPLAYNRDMQEDKESFFDSDATISASLAIMADMLPEISFNRDKMRAACKTGFLNATELADYLARKGVPFRDAHHLSGAAVAAAEKLGVTLEDLPLAQLQEISPLITEDVYAVLEYDACLARKISPGGPGPDSIRNQLQRLANWLAQTDANGSA